MISRDRWIELCKGELGKPYIWGAEGPHAYDCSGFVQWALRPLNLDPPGDQTAEGLYRHFIKGRSTTVDVADATQGDIVFFGSPEAVTHIALAWGNRDMLEAGGGGRRTTSAAIAREQGAQVRIVRISRRRDRIAVLRPTALAWDGADLRALEALGADAAWGAYDGAPPLVEWLDDGRHMRLKKPFAYTQDGGRHWPVPENTVVDGASIPRVLWSLIGGPFEGRYRNASIIHDHYCTVQTRPWRDTHRVFHDAMRCSGVGSARAKVMYYAVYRFGPRWVEGPAAHVEGFDVAAEDASVPSELPVEAFDAASFEADAQLIRETDPDLNAIEALADARGAGAGAAIENAAAALEVLAREAHAWEQRQPLLERLVELQESADDPALAEQSGDLLTRYTRLVRDPPMDTLEARAPALDAMKPKYEALFAACEIRPEFKGQVKWHTDILLRNRARYERVAQITSVPWWFIGVVHALEASFNFRGHLHNGDPLTARTVQVPRGRPLEWNPPNDWESSAVDAIRQKEFHRANDWSPGAALYRWESYNGWGYQYRKLNSPYLWSFSNHYRKGKFVRDGVYDPDAVSKQCGAGVMLRALVLGGHVSL